jgi:hypothetical protein
MVMKKDPILAQDYELVLNLSQLLSFSGGHTIPNKHGILKFESN